MENKQLFEKIANGYIPIYPLASMENIVDDNQSINLAEVLNKYNHLYITFKDNVSHTRLMVPDFLRRYGLFISYELNGNLYTEYFKGSNIDANQEERWGDDSYWEYVPDMKYVNSASSRIPAGAVLPEHLSESLQQLISQHHTITNMVDDEDLTTKDCGIIKFKDREYNPTIASGLGYKILRKNWVNGKNILTQEMINTTNTTYVIRYDYDLNEITINIPEGCVLQFDGGSFNNGIINGNNTNIIGNNYIFRNRLLLTGSFNIDGINDYWFIEDISLDCTKILETIFNISVSIKKPVFLYNYNYIITNLIIPNNCSIIGKKIFADNEPYINDATFISNAEKDTYAITAYGCNIKNIKLICNNTDSNGILFNNIVYKHICNILIHVKHQSVIGGCGVCIGSDIPCYYSTFEKIKIRGFNIGYIVENKNNANFHKDLICSYLMAGNYSYDYNTAFDIKCNNNIFIKLGAEADYTNHLTVTGNSNIIESCWFERRLNTKPLSINILGETNIFKSNYNIDDIIFNPTNKLGYDIEEISSNNLINNPYFKGLNTIIENNKVVLPIVKNNDTTSYSFDINIENYNDNCIYTLYAHYKIIDSEATKFNLQILPYIDDSISSIIDSPRGAGIYNKGIKNEIIKKVYSFRLPENCNKLKIRIIGTSNLNIGETIAYIYGIYLSKGNFKSISREHFISDKGNDSIYGSLNFPLCDYSNAISLKKGYLFIDDNNRLRYKIGKPINNYDGNIIDISEKDGYTIPDGSNTEICIYKHFINVSTNELLTIPLFYYNGAWYKFDGSKYSARYSSSTSNRPTANEIYTGYQYFDVTINKPIWWNGSKWVDANGNNV